MKKIFSIVCMLMVSIAMMAQAQIKFDKTSHDFGKFSESDPIVKCTFTFTNTGDKPLVINQAVASCGCTKSRGIMAIACNCRWRPAHG